MKYTILLTIGLLFFQTTASGQTRADFDSLKREVLLLRTEVAEFNWQVSQSQKKLRNGIITSTIGYTVTIAGGLMLGRQNDKLGQALLIAGGATGATGTAMMIASLKIRDKKKRRTTPAK
jgi:hypothetical protein